MLVSLPPVIDLLDVDAEVPAGGDLPEDVRLARGLAALGGTAAAPPLPQVLAMI